MGSFNVACSISDLSINEGDQIFFIPLLPSQYDMNEKVILEPTSSLIYANCLYNPFCLPIEGRYADYGLIDDIIENENTKAIESFFGIPIQEFVNFVARGDDIIDIEDSQKEKILNRLSGMFVLKEVYEGLAKEKIKEESFDDHYVTVEFAKEIGFREVPSDEQVLFDPHHPILLRKDGFEYDLKVGKLGSRLIHQDFKEYYLFGPDKRYLKEIKQNWEKATQTKLHETFPIDLNQAHINDQEYQMIQHKFRELTGATMGYASGYEKKYDIYRIKVFKKVWKEITQEELDITKYENLCKYDVYYDEFQKQIKKAAKENEEDIKECEDFIKQYDGREEFEFENTVNLYKKRLERLQNQSELNDYWLERTNFFGFFKEWNYFLPLYRKAILNNQLKEECKMYRGFYWLMYSNNKFFFPAMNGEQFGNDKASKTLLQLSLKIVNDRIEKQGDEEDE